MIRSIYLHRFTMPTRPDIEETITWNDLSFVGYKPLDTIPQCRIVIPEGMSIEYYPEGLQEEIDRGIG